jgi:hypothetical protein
MISILCFSLFSVLARATPPPTQSHPGNSMWIEPASNVFNTVTTSVGDEFNVTVYANITSDTLGTHGIGGWQIRLDYDPSMLRAVACFPAEGVTPRQSQFCENMTTSFVWDIRPSYVLAGEACWPAI